MPIKRYLCGEMRLTILLTTLMATLAGAAASPHTARGKTLTTEDGLANNYVTDLEADSHGCLWIASESGLDRFDGYAFDTYNSRNSALTADAVNCLYYDRAADILYAGAKGCGLYAIDCSSHKLRMLDLRTPKGETIGINGLTHISRAADGGLWITGEFGLVHCQPKALRAEAVNAVSRLRERAMCAYDDGHSHIYIGMTQSGLAVYNTRSRQLTSLLTGARVYAICPDRTGNIWIGTDHGLALRHAATGQLTFFRHSPQRPGSIIADHVYDIRLMADGRLWIATDIGGVSILDPRTLALTSADAVSFTNLTAAAGQLASGNIRSLLQDPAGNIWAGNYGSGVDFFSHTRPAITTFGAATWGLLATADGRLYAGGEDCLRLYTHGSPTRKFDIRPQLTRSAGQVFAIAPDGPEALLLGIYDDGLLRLDTRSGRVSRVAMDKPNVDIITFLRHRSGATLVGTENGIYRYQSGQMTKDSLRTRGLGAPAVYGLATDRLGRLWAGTYGGGLTVFAPDGTVAARITKCDGLAADGVNSIFRDRRGRIWVATREGITLFPDPTHPSRRHTFGADDGLADPYVRAIVEDRRGRILASTNSRLALYDEQCRRFLSFDRADGVASGNFIESSAAMAADGTLYFGSLGGICRVDSDRLAAMQRRRVADVHISLPDTTLDCDYGALRVAFSVADYSQAGQVEYAYSLDPEGRQWTSAGADRQITLAALPHGTHRLRVRARLKNHPWTDCSEAAITITVRPPLYLTWYAKTLYALLLAAAALLAVRLYRRRLLLKAEVAHERQKALDQQALNDERLRFYTNITHELRTPLTLIIGPLDDLAADNDMPEACRTKLKAVQRSAQQLLTLVGHILEFRKTETSNRRLRLAAGDLAAAVRETALRFKELTDSDSRSVILDIDDCARPVMFDREIITTILSNLLSNAAKYTPDGSITVSLHWTDEQFRLAVSDTGYGIAPDALPHIFDRYYQAWGPHQAAGTGIGLALVKSLAELHHLGIAATSNPGQGTTIEITGNAVAPEAAAAPAPAPAKESAAPLLLIVEDNDDIRQYTASSLAGDYQVITASDGAEGLRKAQAETPDMIVSDVMMPEMDGVEMCRRVKEDVRTSHIPVILLTAKDTISDKEQGFESGADAYLTKPFSARLLKACVDNQLNVRKKLAEIILSASGETPQETGPKLNPLDSRFLEKLYDTIDSHLDDPDLTQSMLQSELAMSQSTLYRKVKSLTGISCNVLIRRRRLAAAYRLIKSGEANVSEAAYRCGFGNLPYFRQQFRELYGSLPSEIN